MLPKQRRIERKSFKEILSRGKRYNSTHLLLYVVTTSSGKSDESKFSFSVSKKILKNATDRNLFRRRGYAVVGKVIEKIKPGFTCFFLFKKESKNISYSELEREILELLSTASVLP